MSDDTEGEFQPDGLFTRKGSYASAMVNAYYFDQLATANNPDFDADVAAIIEIERELIPTLDALGIIGFFSIPEWLDTTHQGRHLIALLYLDQHRDLIDHEIRGHLGVLRDRVSPRYLLPAIDALCETPPQPAFPQDTETAAPTQLVHRPEALLPDGVQGRIDHSGVFYRKGTTIATYENVRRYDELRHKLPDETAAADLRHTVNDQQFITTMMSVGMYFSLFPPIDWFADAAKEGRMMPALLLLTQYPWQIDKAIVARLEELKSVVSQPTERLIDDVLDALRRYVELEKKSIAVVQSVFRRYLAALEHQRDAVIASIWADDDDVTLVGPGAHSWIRGKERILEFLGITPSHTQVYGRTLETAEVALNLPQGTARVMARLDVPNSNPNVIGEANTGLVVQAGFRRLSIPSCVPVLKGDGETTAGEWHLVSWNEGLCIAPTPL
ncbi:hypothetical protein [Planctomycetes bacterium Pan216]